MQVRDAKDVVAVLGVACSPEGGGWKGPAGLQLSSDFEASRFKGLGNSGVRLFVDAALSHFRVLRALDLGFNSIGPEGAATLALGLEHTACRSTLTALSLRINLLGDAGVAAIARGLEHLVVLEHLDLSNNWVQHAGAEQLAGGLRACSRRLKTLDLSRNNLKTAGCGHLADVASCLPALVQISLQKNAIDHDGAAHVAAMLNRCRHLVFCDLTCNRLGPAGTASLVAVMLQHPRCNLELAGNDMGAEGASRLADALRSTACSSSPAPLLAASRTASQAHGSGPGRHLLLFNNSMGTEGMAMLTPVLPLLPNLLSLDLGHQFMYSAGAEHLATVSLSLSLSLSLSPSLPLSLALSLSLSL